MRLACVIWWACVVVAASALAQGRDDLAVVIQHDERGEPVVRTIEVSGPARSLAEPSLVVWAEQEQDHWAFLPTGARWPLPGQRGLSDISRDLPIGRSDMLAPGTFTTLLEPLTGVGVVRGGGLLSPYPGAFLINPKVTIRRKSNGETLPATTAILSHSGRELLRIPLASNQTEASWDDIAQLPRALADGLQPGQYVLRLEDAPDRITFTIATPSQRDAVMQPLDELSRLVGDTTDSLYVQLALERLAWDRPSQPAFLAEALDLLDSVPPLRRTQRMQRWREHLLSRLEDPGQQPRPRVEVSDPTGIPAIDELRSLIASSRWQEGLAAADRLIASPDANARAKGFAHLYRGMILSEANFGVEDDMASRRAFDAALLEMSHAAPEDLWRVHLNLSVFWHNRAEDQLNNHSLQIATGAKHPLLSALQAWIAADRHNQTAIDLSKQLGSSAADVAIVNRARLYALLADIASTLSGAEDAQESGAALERAARRTAQRLAAQSVGRQGTVPPSIDPSVSALALALTAQLAFRQGDFQACRDVAEAARERYLDSGCLAGVESMERLLGLAERMLSEAAGDPHQRAAHGDEALRHFLIAHHVAELLRERFPAGVAGRQRAGFFARRAYVYEQLVALFIARGQPVEALRYAEHAKARSLQDMLAARGVATPGHDDARDLDALLRDWPNDVAAVEYFLGRQRAWVFLVDCGGAVSVHALCDESRQPLQTAALVAETRQFLDELPHYAVKMRGRLLAGAGFDASWQHRLRRFTGLLIPEDALAAIARAKTLIVVPHHILHYFPFAALVTEVDQSPRAAADMVQPRFLIDLPLDLCHQPSLGTWDLLRRRMPAPRGQAIALAIEDLPGAPRLPGVVRDVDYLRQAFGEGVRSVHLGQDATLANAKRALREPGLVLFAMHGVNFPDNPLQSCLWLYPSAYDDGRLTALEIFQQDVRADMVVLSACYSGLADRSPLPGDDLFGLQRSLLHAGAGSVMSGLWDVYDGTGPELLHEFFQRWTDGKPAAAAWCGAQRAFLNKLRASQSPEPWLHPYFWAVYTLSGDDR